MNVNISGRHFEVSEALHDYALNKVTKMGRYFSNITNVHVILSLDNKFLHKAEARINLAKGEIFADDEAEDMYAAIDKMTDKLERQVIKHKEKLNHRHGHNGDEML